MAIVPTAMPAMAPVDRMGSLFGVVLVVVVVFSSVVVVEDVVGVDVLEVE